MTVRELIITLLAWILISIGCTLPFAYLADEWKIWCETWFIIIVMMILIVSGLRLLGVM